MKRENGKKEEWNVQQVHDWTVKLMEAHPEIAERLKEAGLPVTDIRDLAAKATSIIGVPDALPFGDKVVGIVMDRHGKVLDKIRNIED